MLPTATLDLLAALATRCDATCRPLTLPTPVLVDPRPLPHSLLVQTWITRTGRCTLVAQHTDGHQFRWETPS